MRERTPLYPRSPYAVAKLGLRKFVSIAAAGLGMAVRWQGEGVDEIGLDAQGRTIVRVDPRYFRPTEVETLLGDPTSPA